MQAEEDIKLFRPGLDNTRLFISLTAGAGFNLLGVYNHNQEEALVT